MKKKLLFIPAVLISTSAWAQEPENNDPLHIQEIFITGGKEEILTTPGSAHLVDKEQLEKFEYSDVHRVLESVPGVYIRTEDGFGLRPNIGMRGAPANRSAKISIMEDGILIAPAPYSAPEAYFFPNVARMENVEVFKGPVSIEYGPNTVGGAINMITTSIPEEFAGEVEVAAGSDGYQKFQANVGDSYENFSWLVEGLTYGSDGFKELDNGGDTGFDRNDAMLKLRYESDANSDRYQRFDLKLSYADETSDETYLGLTDDDFDDNPYRRYAASQLDKLEWDQQQIAGTHFIELNDSWALTTRLYRNEFSRAWNKFEDFRENHDNRNDPFTNASLSVKQVLNNPTGLGESKYYDLLTGNANSNGTELQKLDVTNNDRDYLAQGVQMTFTLDLERGSTLHEIDAGFRFHNDSVERRHSVRAYNMIDGKMVYDGIERSLRTRNKGETDAIALFVKDKISFEKWTITAGLRGEFYDSEFTNFLSNTKRDRSEEVFLPGVGAFYQYTPNLGLLAGIHKGFTPNGPTASEDADPEVSINTEFGLRYNKGKLSSEALGFYNRYSNLIGRCGGSDDCPVVGEEFNGGRVDMLGLELSGHYAARWGEWNLPLNMTYTYTKTAFQTSFISEFPEWGVVEKGDELPYVPNHQLNVKAGLEKDKWDANLSVTYTGSMKETASSGSDDIDSYVVTDFAGAYQVSKPLRLQLNVDNVLDEEAIVARRPLGARPNKPRTISASLKYAF